MTGDPNHPRRREPAYRRPNRGRTPTARKGIHGGWDGILDESETILWQGRPASGMGLQAKDFATLVFGAIFGGFALFWMAMAWSAPGNFWAFGLIHFGVGLGIMLWPIVGRPYVRAHTTYTLTDRRAFVGKDLPLFGRRLDSHPIRGDTAISLDDGSPGSVYFASHTRRTKNGTRTTRIGFERIDAPRKVFGLMRKAQKSAETPE